MCDRKFGWNLAMLFLTLACLFSYVIRANTVSLPSVRCSPHTEVVQVDPVLNRYIPLYIKLHRCRGSIQNANPNIKACVATTMNTLKLDVIDTTTSVTTIFEVNNHTACGSACVKSRTDCNKYQWWKANQCICQCKYDAVPSPSPCETPFVWNQPRCDCECSTGPVKCENDRQEWTAETCGCTCKKRYSNRCSRKEKVLDAETCNCINPPVVYQNNGSAVTAKRIGGGCLGSVKQSIVILIVVLELLVIVVLFALFYRFCLQKDDSKFYAMYGTLTRKFPFKNKEYKNTNNVSSRVDNVTHCDANTESRISLTAMRPTEEEFNYTLEQEIEKNNSYDSAIGWYNETMDVDGPKRTPTPSDFSSDPYTTESENIGQVTIV